MKINKKLFVLAAALVLTSVPTPSVTYAKKKCPSINSETAISGASLSVAKGIKDEKKLQKMRELLRPDLYEKVEETTSEGETTIQPTEDLPELQPFFIISTASEYVNVRTMPSTDPSTIVGKMYKGAVGVVDAQAELEDGIWYHMNSGAVNGYVRADFFDVIDEETAYAVSLAAVIGTVNYKANNLYVRSGPSVSTEPYTMIARGTQVVITGEEGDFYQIQLDEACVGYVHKDYIDVTRRYITAISLSEEKAKAEADFQAAQEAMLEEQAAEQASRAQAEAESMAASQEAEALQQAQLQAAIQASLEAAARESAIAESIALQQQQQQAAPVTVVGVQAAYIGGTKYVGQTVSGAELRVLGIFSDGNVYPVDGWGCMEVGQPLAAGDNVFTVNYQGYLNSFVVNAKVPETTAPPATQPQATQPQETQPQETQPPVNDTASLRSNIVAYALQFVGNPYVYGGTDLINGVDCSGFTMGVYSAFAINITRTSRSQAAAGREISFDALAPGDLLFYTDVKTGAIGHVGLYIGNGQMIHAANETLGIIISDWNYRQPCKAVTFL